MGKVSWTPVSEEELGESGLMSGSEPQFIKKADSDIVFDNDPDSDAFSIDKQFGAKKGSLKDNDGDK